MDASVFVGRQPILDRNGNLFGYELLYRNSEVNRFPDVNPEKATIGVLVNTFLTIGVDRVSGAYPSFINFTGELLAQDLYDHLNPARVIIEVLEDVEITPTLLTKLRKLKNQGFRIALDDFVLSKEYEVEKGLFPLVDFIKVDFIQSDRAERQRIQNFVRMYPNVQLLAEKIETEVEFEEAKKAGYTLFQGYFFATPEVVSGAEVPSIEEHNFRIMDRLNTELPSIKDVASLITQDMSLTYKLLRFINTYAFGIPKKIKSIQQAIILIGLQETKKWLYIITIHQMGVGDGKGRIKALVDYSLVRAKMCELLAKRLGQQNSDEYFLVGMFSMLNVILQRDWDEIEHDIPLSDDVMHTLMGKSTQMAPYLQMAIAVERLDLPRMKALCKELDIPLNDLCVYSQEAIRWGRQLD
ncbi:HDOD domain-containing protein [Sporosarcina jeotgali]|uniref:HDOD domain-containing protein n=1 Tax=Sporosarcina jeotgali TaxID=3020056 RepID=A0ABZ0KYR2_9BACL|nr:HDOD domain-containing protein [Sporosarcina sp. B2O-1]WOV84993.1 HDOD domain-containing protein [Sporosarcina sp. B2O-1]